MKFCKDCMYFRGPYLHRWPGQVDKCVNPKSAFKPRDYHIYGVFDYNPATLMREKGPCGMDAKLYEVYAEDPLE